MCGNKELVGLSRIEKNFMDSLQFKCQHEEEHDCQAVLKYENIRTHLEKDCVHKIEFPIIVEEKKVEVIVAPPAPGPPVP